MDVFLMYLIIGSCPDIGFAVVKWKILQISIIEQDYTSVDTCSILASIR